MAKDKHAGSSQPAAASTGTLKQTEAGKRAAKRCAEVARSSVTAEAIAAAQAVTEIIASQASGGKGAQPVRTLQLLLLYYADKISKT